MSSSLNSSALARAAAEQASAKFDAQSFLSRKSDMEAGTADVFAKVFASAQEAQKPRQPAELKTEDTAPEQDVPADRAVHSRGTAKTKNAGPSTDDAREAHQGDEAAAPQPKQAAKAEKKSGKHECKAKDDQKSDKDAKAVADAATAAPVKAEATDDTEVTAAETAQVAIDQAPDTKDAAAAAAAFCLPAVLKAQEVAGAGTSSDEDGSQEQEGTPGKAALADLTTFRANPSAGVKKAGKDLAAAVAGVAANANAGVDIKADAAGVKTDAKADVKTGFETEIKKPELKAADVTAMFQPQVAKEAKNDAVAEFTASVQGDAPKKSAGDASSAGTPEKIEAANDAAADAPVSQTPPAAGSRVNALLGFPAPTPTGSGSGSPFAKAAAGNGVEMASGMGAISTSARIDGGAVIQLAKVVKTDGAMMTSPTEQVAVSLTRMVKNGGSSFEVQLNPAELGKVEIKLDISKDGVVNAVVTSDNPKTHDMLQKDAGALAKVFQDAGLQADSGSLSFNLRSDAQQQQAANQGDQPAWKRWNNNQPAEVAATAQPEFYTAAPGRVDMMI